MSDRIKQNTEPGKQKIPGTPKEELITLLLHDPVGGLRAKPIIKKGPYEVVFISETKTILIVQRSQYRP